MRAAEAIRERGFTLVEAVIVIGITGILAAIVAVFIVRPVEGYYDAARRAEMTDTADTALRRIARDLRLALPNSVRTSGNQAMEFLLTRTGGRYRAAAPDSGTFDILDFNDPNDKSFDVLGPAMSFETTSLTNQNEIVIYNLGIPGADAYEGVNRRTYAGPTGAVSTIQITSSEAFPADSPSHRFQVVETPVSYICDLAEGTLTRYWGYTITNAQAVPPAPASSAPPALLASNVSACTFSYAAGFTARNGLVTLRLSITEGGETVTLYHEVHVSNVP